MWIIYFFAALSFIVGLLLALVALRWLPPDSRVRRVGELLIALIGLATVIVLFWNY